MVLGYETLLARLDSDPQRGEAAFEQLRRTLVRFFGWRGVGAPDDAADETLDRVARRLAEGHAVQDVSDFALGIARMVLRESWRARRFEPLTDSGAMQVAAAPDSDPTIESESAMATYLDHCLATLTESARSLVLDYYAGSTGRNKIEARRALATAHGLGENALRSRVQRLRDRLEECVRTQLKAAAQRPTRES
ncbi:MAG: hypothetical protein U0V87_04570 [Acidobacteriota bacterium]